MDIDLNAAIEYHRWGLVALPCAPRKKHPLVKWEPYQGIKKVTENDVRAWFGTVERRGIWLLCGPQSGIVVVDLDYADSVTWFRRTCPDLDFATIPRVKSSKGWHLYFAYAEGATQWHHDGTVLGLNINLDVRNGDRGGVMAPPTVHESGHVYEWQVRPALDGTGKPMWPSLPAQLYTKVTAGLTAAGADGTGSAGGSAGRSQLNDLLLHPPEPGGRNVWLTQGAGHLAKQYRGMPDLYNTMFDRILLPHVPGLTPEEIEKTRQSVWRKENAKPESEVRPAPADTPELAHPNDPMRVARQLVERRWTTGGLPTLRRWRDDFYYWTGTKWVARPDAAVRSEIWHHTEHATYLEKSKAGDWETKRWLPGSGKVSNVLDAAEAVVYLDDAVTPPAWTGTGAHAAAVTFVPIQNGLLAYPGRKLIDHTPGFFNLASSPYDYDPSAARPGRWLDFLNRLWPDDPASIELLQEWFGLSLTADLRYQKILLLVGPQRAGKGTIIRVLTELIGSENVASPTAASFAQNFGMMSLLGKSLAVMPDARIAGRDAQTLVERLLAISGGDELDVDRKNKTQWHGRLGARLVVVSNELPRLPDSSGALANRYLPLRLTRSWLGREDRDLADRLVGDMPGVLNWALDGLDRLTERKRFVLPTSSAEEIADLEVLSSPVLAFVRDWCEVGPEREVAVDRLYGKWAQWCMVNGVHLTPKNVFSKDLQAAVPGLGKGRPRDGAARVRTVVGIGLTKDADKDIPSPTSPGVPYQTKMN